SPLALPAAPAGVDDGMIARPPGVAQIAAAPLRRALMRSGFNDVMNTAVDGSTVVRALNSHRFSGRVLEALQHNAAQFILTSLNAAPGSDGSAGGGVVPSTNTSLQAAVTQAASQVGQALGYRAVLVLGVLPPELAGLSGAAPAANGAARAGRSTLPANPLSLPNESAPASAPAVAIGSGAPTATFTMLIVDAMRETGEVLIFDETGSGELARNEAAAATSAALVSKAIGNWPIVTEQDKVQRVNEYITTARAAVAARNWETAQDKLNQVLALDPKRAEASLLMGDVLAAIDPAAAISSYRRAVAQNAKDGATWAKIAIAHTVGNAPDWPRALDAGRKALAAKFDSAGLRQAMATAQLGRAQLLRAAGRIDRAEDAELDARQHLDRALELAPEDPSITRLMTRQLVMQGRFREAIKALDRIAVQYPEDADIQTQYATSLLEIAGREEDAFVAWARVWTLTGQQAAPADPSRYRRLSEGFDQRIANLGKKAKQLTTAVASNSTPRDTALLQLSRYKEDMTSAVAAIKVIQPGADGQGGAVHASRIFAADLMSQTLEAHQLYLETGQEIYRARAGELNRQAMVTLNTARSHQ
ncbi:MAG: Tetratricopeptide repeat, partial [Abditibacteriota bacterium]|nr:Tetratricopeptide repeat [Abditibacteriota bacterium]